MSTVNKHKPASSIQTPNSGYTTLFFDENGVLYSKDEDGNLARYDAAGDASGITYTPDDSLLWTDSVDPGNVAEALDDLAVRLNAAENDLATPPDASVVTYTPQTSLHWTDSEDPGQVDDALDDLAARVNAIEEQGPGSGSSFGTIAVGGQSNVVADVSSDTLTLAAGQGIAITTNAGADTVTIVCDVDASEVTFTPGNSVHWTDSEDPGQVDDALDDLAARVQALEENPGGGVSDATDLTYTPTTLADWDGGTDPGDAQEAFDQLAERVTDLEAGGGGDFVKIAEVVTTGSQATITFSSIPSTYRNLKIVLNGRGSASSTAVRPRMTMNGDTGSNYTWKFYNNAGNQTSASDTALSVGEINGGTSPANGSGSAEILIPDYKSTVFHKNFSARTYVRIGTLGADNFPDVAGGTWLSTAAISSLALSFASGNWVDGSVATLYGMN